MAFYNKKIRCECGKWAKPKTFNVEGFWVRGWQCPKCDRIEYSDDINRVLMINKLKKQHLRVKVGVLGQSKIVRMPKELLEVVDLAKGETIDIYPESPRKIAIEVSEKD